jgi:hypothetical protein
MVTGELIAATTELQRAVRLVDVRWNSWGPRAPVLGVAVFELFVGGVTGDLGKGARRGLRGAADWTQRADAAIVAELSAPTGRVEAALARAVLLADQDVVNAAVAVSEALTAVTAAYAQTQMIAWGKKADENRAARAAADTVLQDALGELIIVAREVQVPKGSWGWAADLGLIDQDSLNDLREMFPGRPMRTLSMRGIIMSEYGAGPDGATINTEDNW